PIVPPLAPRATYLPNPLPTTPGPLSDRAFSDRVESHPMLDTTQEEEEQDEAEDYEEDEEEDEEDEEEQDETEEEQHEEEQHEAEDYEDYEEYKEYAGNEEDAALIAGIATRWQQRAAGW